MIYENERTEFKEQFIPEIYKEVIAFANTEGGVIFIGVDDEGNAVGLDNVDETYTKVTNGIRDAILPDVTMFVKYTLENGNIIRIEVGEGTYKPYYLKSKGLKSSGVYVRQGASSVPASPEQIRQMIKEADGEDFESFRALNQNLTFQSAADIFARNKVAFSEDKYFQLGIRNHESKLYTNLALLLSDQCRHTVKIAIFSDEDNTVFQDKKEFSGSIFRQLEEAYEYLQLCNRNRAEILGLERQDHWDYPEAALREALINALIHRDYSYSGSIIININQKQTEFISIGGLLPGISPEDIKNGISLSRNPKLAEIFHRLRFIESYGTGIRRIFALYKKCSKQPEIFVTSHSFRMVLPNMNEAGMIQETYNGKVDNDKVLTGKKHPANMTPQMEKVLAHLTKYKEMSPDDVKELLGVKETRAYVIMKQLSDTGLVDVIGRGKNKKYCLTKNIPHPGDRW